MREGQGRIYPRIAGMNSEVDYLIELHNRAGDLVADLPDDVLRVEIYGHSIQQLQDHMIQAEHDWFSQIAGIRSNSPSPDAKNLNRFARSALSAFDLETQVTVGPFTCVGQVLRHLQWHWTYHSAQIGILRKALGHEYKWTFKKER